jgi:DNA modification methylase
MEGKKARILICDPPYNLPANFFTNKDEKRHDDFAMGAGEMSDEEFVTFLEAIMKGGVDHTVEGGIHYVFMDWRHVWHMTEAGRRVYGSVIPKQLCVWKKDNMANGSFYRAQQELCFVFASAAAKNLWNRDLLDEGGFYKENEELVFIFKNGESAKHLSHLDMADRIRTNVWNYPSAVSIKNPDRYLIKDHPTPKPVAMIADAILDTTNLGEGVIDWFLGSGTALIAAEKTGRVCYATEIKPQYVQSIIKRYVLFCTKNNKPVDFQHINGSLTLNDFRNESNIAGGKI